VANNVVHLHAAQADPQEDVLRVYKSVYALCTTGKEGKVLRATHYAAVLVHGAHPIWGVWSITGKFLRFANGRTQVESMYPKLVWRRWMLTWQCIDASNKSLEQRRFELERLYNKRPPE